MGTVKKTIRLSDGERKQLRAFVSKGEHPSRIIRRAQIILAVDGRQETDGQIASRLGVSRQSVHAAKHDYAELGMEDFLHRRKRKTPPVPAKVDGNYEAHLIALCCGKPPEGYQRWSVRLLADKSVELGYIDSISHTTVSRVLKKTNLSPI